MARGHNAMADILKATVDGRDLNALWAEFRDPAERTRAPRWRRCSP